MKKIFSIVRFLIKSPLNRGHKVASIIKFVMWQLKNLAQQPIQIIDWIDSSKFAVRKGETALTGNIYAGLIEFEDMCFCFHALRQEDLFLDVGANVGSYTIIAGKVVGAKVVSFEPIPATFETLKSQIALNEIEPNVTAYNMGVSNKPGKIQFTNNLGAMNHVLLENDKSYDNGVEVDTTTLDNAIDIDRDCIMKIDVEGFELNVLKGGHSLLSDTRILAIIIEINGNGEAFGVLDDQIHVFLTQLGYFPVSYDPFTRKITVEPSFDGQDNTIYIRNLNLIQTRCENAPRRKIHTAFDQQI